MNSTIINLNSIDAVKNNGTMNSSLVFPFTNILSNKNKAYLSVLSCQVPVSFYNINENNNGIDFIVNGSPISISIGLGNYNSNTLATSIQTELSLSLVTMTIILNKTNGKLSFTISSGTFSILDSSSMLYVLGLNGTKASTGTTLVMDFPLNLLGTLNLNFSSNSFNTSTSNSKNMGSKNVFLSLPVNVDVFSVIQLNEKTDRLQLHTKSISLIDINVFDDNHNYINFNNADFSMSILLEWNDEPNNELIKENNNNLIEE